MLNARNIDIGPILPKYIAQITIILPATLSEEVIPLVKPTVATALAISNVASDNPKPFVIINKMLNIKNTQILIVVTAKARFTTASLILLLNATVCLRPLTTDTTVKNKTAIDTVFIPPAVPT